MYSKCHPNYSVVASKALICKFKGKGMCTCYSTATWAQQHFIILDVATDWHELVIPWLIMQPSIAHNSGQLDLRCSTADIPLPQSAALGLHPISRRLLLINWSQRDGTLSWRWYTADTGGILILTPQPCDHKWHRTTWPRHTFEALNLNLSSCIVLYIFVFNGSDYCECGLYWRLGSWQFLVELPYKAASRAAVWRLLRLMHDCCFSVSTAADVTSCPVSLSSHWIYSSLTIDQCRQHLTGVSSLCVSCVLW